MCYSSVIQQSSASASSANNGCRKKSRTCKLAPELPSVIVSDILSRLEIKDIGRARPVCKEWNAITTDSHFINTLLNRASQHLLLHTYSQFAIVKNVDLINQGEDSLNATYFPIEDHYDMGIVGYCNGLVCIIHRRYLNPVYIYNPVTGESSKLPKLRFGSKHDIYTRISSIGFGFDQFNSKYKVFVEIRNGSARCKYNCKIITLGESSWRTLNHPDSKNYYVENQNQKAAFYNGFFHWVLNDRMVLSLDICNEIFKTLEIPPSVKLDRTEGDVKLTLRTLGETLALVPCNYRFRVKMWHINGSEFHEQAFEPPPPATRRLYSKLISKLNDGSYLFQRKGQDNCLACQDNCLALYSSEQEQVRMEKISGIPFLDYEAISFAPSLLSPRALTA